MKKMLTEIICLLTLFCPAVHAVNSHYAIIIDAGSSGSRLHLFQIDIQKNMPIIQELFSEETKPGISSYASHPGDAGPALKKLLDDAVIHLNQMNVDPKVTSLSLLATAGMRLLPEAKQAEMYTQLSQYFNSHYPFAPGQVATIPGKMEALYGWLDINYLSRTFQDNLPSVGSIDLGGASTEIAFEMPMRANPTDRMMVKINNRSYSVFTHSFLGLGQDQALATISRDLSAATCYPNGYSASHLSGHFDFSSCSRLYNTLLQNQQVKKEILPLTGKHFVAYSAFYFNLNFLGADKTPDQSVVESRIHSVCTLSWQQIQQTYSGIAAKYLAPACANNTYVYDLLFVAYSLRADQLTVTNQINQQPIDWALGAALYQWISHS